MTLAAYHVQVPAKPGRPSLPSDAVERVRAAMKRLRDERYEGNVTKLGKALGISQSAVSQLLADVPKNRPSFATTDAVARLLGVSVHELLSGPAEAVVVEPDVYPNRARAVAAARLLGKDERAIERVRQIPGSKSDEDRPVGKWFERIEAEETMLEEPGRLPAGARVLNPAGGPLPAPPPRGRRARR